MYSVTECPACWLTAELREMLELLYLWKQGSPPVAGGSLDQTSLMIEAARFTWSEQNRVKNQMGLIDGQA